MLVLGLGLAIKLGFNAVTLYQAVGRLTTEQARLEEVKRENQELKDRLAVVQTPEYMEREAREKLGLGFDGEVVVVIPEEEIQTDRGGGMTEVEEVNWVKWRKLYLGW